VWYPVLRWKLWLFVLFTLLGKRGVTIGIRAGWSVRPSSWVAYSRVTVQHRWCIRYFGRLILSYATRKYRTSLWSTLGWSDPPPFWKKHSVMNFRSILWWPSISTSLVAEFPLSTTNLKLSSSGWYLLTFQRNLSVGATLHAFAITSSVMVIGTPITADLISVCLKGSRSISFLVFPLRLGSLATTCSSSAFAASTS